MCGTAEWEWDAEQGGNRYAYEAVEKFCWGCYIKAGVSRDADTGDGRTIELMPTTGADAARRHIEAKRHYLQRGKP